ncbi:NAD(P)-binding protein [Lophiostoma macrostomum CBS 122681]|uniref:NAD(P)-binding protein n=1 Tax=Lophiostoma macrostomum CBS 122681 TaxID=1314788 RepID=A0A6A6TPV2_9PLEO|nr:NAD(P)-binding protein [Lophiostoma macrostomum CBS 122681]
MSQSILIVGGGDGIGLETTRAILAASTTAKIVVFGLHIDPELEAKSKDADRRTWTISGDVTSKTDRNKAVDTCVNDLGGLDTLVYCAGVITPIERIERVDIGDVKKAYDVNVFGSMAMAQLCIPYLRKSAASNHKNAAYGKAIFLSSACDTEVSYHGWMPYCTTKAALTRFIQMFAHEEPNVSVQGVYPKLTRTKMPEDVINGKYKGIMADHEIERFRIWNEIGDEMVEPPKWCGEAVAKLALGLFAGGKSGETLYYDEHVPRKIAGT